MDSLTMDIIAGVVILLFAGYGWFIKRKLDSCVSRSDVASMITLSIEQKMGVVASLDKTLSGIGMKIDMLTKADSDKYVSLEKKIDTLGNKLERFVERAEDIFVRKENCEINKAMLSKVLEERK